jgi:hypothetical protein
MIVPAAERVSALSGEICIGRNPERVKQGAIP